LKRIDADHAATTRLAPEVLEAMRPFLGDAYGNASSVHTRGEAARDAVAAARDQIAGLIRAQSEEIVFTASGSEANNLALKGVLAGMPDPRRRRVLVSAIEHPSVLETARFLATRGIELELLPVRPNGIVDPDVVREALRDDVALVSVMAVNNETGAIQPIEEIGPFVKDAGAIFHVDAVQAAGKLPVAVDAWQADLVSLAAHKLYGPLGAAALFVRRRVKLVPLVHGGQQERGRRAGTENLAAIVGLGAACARARAQLAAGLPQEIEAFGERLLAELLLRVPDMRLNGDLNRRVGAIVNVCFAGVDGEAVLHELDAAGVTVSTGSACSSGQPGPSHVLLAMGLPAEDAHASVRFSLGEETQEADVATIAEVTPPIVERLRALAGRAVEKSA
jgi:cysteine desulfurase